MKSPAPVRSASHRNHNTFEGHGSVLSKLAEQEQQLRSDDLNLSAKPKEEEQTVRLLTVKCNIGEKKKEKKKKEKRIVLYLLNIH